MSNDTRGIVLHDDVAPIEIVTPAPVAPRGVLVTTAARGVFFGYLVGAPSKERVVLNRMRNVTYWDDSVRSFVGLASTGPSNACRVSPPAGDESILFDITGVFGCTEAAVTRFELGPWK